MLIFFLIAFVLFAIGAILEQIDWEEIFEMRDLLKKDKMRSVKNSERHSYTKAGLYRRQKENDNDNA